MNVDDLQWKDVLWSSEDEPLDEDSSVGKTTDEDDIFAYEDEPDLRDRQKDEWTGSDRDHRSAFLITGSLKIDGSI